VTSLCRRAFIASLAALAAPVHAQRRAPAFPANALTSLAHWDDGEFLRVWQAPEAGQRLACRAWPGPCELFGVKAHGASAFFEDGRLISISLLFLDAGAWFGFGQGDAAPRVPEFLAAHKQVAAAVETGVTGLGGKLRDVALGGKSLLKHTGRVAKLGEAWSRLVVWPEHLVKLTLFRDEDAATQLLAPWRRTEKRDEQARTFASLVRTAENGDRIISGIPLLQQGDRAYCGMSALAMTMQHLGLRIETEELAAAAGIRFGSTRDAKTREVYDAAGHVGAIRIERTQKFEAAKARAAIETGMPVIAFRRWSQERDFIHTAFARRFADDPTATLPRADMNDRKLWPQRDGYAHASIVNGFNAVRGEVIFTESWSEHARDRRMRFEEMEATSYMACYPRLA
jgi:hypothetical protein